MLYLFDYNQEAFYMLTKCVNNVLRLRNSIEIFYDANKVFPENSCQITEQADILVTECMNNMHSFIFSIPKMNKLYEEHGRKWAIIVYNGDGLYLRLPGKLTLPGTMLQNKTKTYKILMKDDGLIICKGKFGINDCLQLIKDQFQNVISHICIISGDLASRGLSFVSMDNNKSFSMKF
jgi:hypothetical protein